MNYTDLDVLGSLRCAENLRELTPAELMRAAMITSGAMSICLDRLEKKKLIKRRVSKEDRRVRKVSITPAGISLIDEAFSLRFGAARVQMICSSLKQLFGIWVAVARNFQLKCVTNRISSLRHRTNRQQQLIATNVMYMSAAISP